MFDDQSKNLPGGQAPGNLPVAEEPEDIFSNTESAEPPSSVSALEAGILRPKIPLRGENDGMAPRAGGDEAPETKPVSPPMAPPPNDNGLSAAQMPQDMYQIKGPVLSRGVITSIIGFVFLVIVAGGGWWIYASFVKPDSGEELFDANASRSPADKDSQFAPLRPAETPEAAPAAENKTTIEPSDLSREVVDSAVLFGEPLDADDDQLDDQLEQTAGTDPNNWDTDNDGLGDGDEVLVWETDPLNPDTDGDSFLDGGEIKSGYSPIGPGKLFTPPTSTP